LVSWTNPYWLQVPGLLTFYPVTPQTDGHVSQNHHVLTSLFSPCAVERYDPRTNRWASVSPMGTRRKHLGVAVYSNMIYAVGGRDDATELSSAERYNPQTNAWQPVVAMTCRRSGVSHADALLTMAIPYFLLDCSSDTNFPEMSIIGFVLNGWTSAKTLP
jgi:N-acetylneuraminic acid mutarotase